MLLQEALRDSSQGVVRGALGAIDAILEVEEDADSPVFATLKSMLMQGDPNLQVAIAGILHRCGHLEGTEALRRLAVHKDWQVRHFVAQTVSGSGDQQFVPLLLRFLDDGHATVKSEALKGLPQLTGENIGRGGTTQQQIEQWKAWGKSSK
jgi:HEAT repeat protein